MRKVINILLFISCYLSNASTHPDSVSTKYKYISKKKLVLMIDSFLELEYVSTNDINTLNYYSSLLNNTTLDSVKIGRFDLSELSFYASLDEKALFPPTPLDSLPNSFNLNIENEYLSYFQLPIAGVVTSNYGWRDGRMHKGIDIDLNKGDKVSAAFDGKVRIARRQGGFGNVVILMHPNGLETVYAHLHKIKVKEGDVVLSGQIIGLGGNTGHSRGTHLHFEMRYKGHPLNPGAIVSFTNAKTYHHTITIKNSKYGLCAFPSNAYVHTVERGDSWHAIASAYGLSTKQLMELNGISKRYYLKVGQQIRVN
ncbi:MAG: peptidoglycan DD-metalloendopeptidase family protein [Bacteroidota bacterium]